MVSTPDNAVTPPGQFGRRELVLDQRTINLGEILTAERVQAPESLGWTQAETGWDFLGNDIYGNCVEAAMLHQVMVWQQNTGAAGDGDLTMDTALAMYAAISGWRVTDGPPGPGTIYLDAMRYWRHQGIPRGRKAWGFGSIELRNHQAVKDAIFALGGVQFGFDFPPDMDWGNGYWVPTGTAGDPLRGHGIVLVDYTSDWLWGISWGRLYPIRWDFADKYGLEQYGVLSEDWQRNPTTPAGVDLRDAADIFAAELATATA